jgi:hypothetical protein
VVLVALLTEHCDPGGRTLDMEVGTLAPITDFAIECY